MESERSKQPESRARQARAVAIAGAILFLISSAFPITAGLPKNAAAFPKWWGVLDVVIAFVLASVAIARPSFAAR